MKNKKDIYRLLNEVHVDVEYYEPIRVSVSEKEKILQNITSKKSRSKRKNRPILVFSLLMVTFVTAFLPPVKAAIQSVIETVQYTLSDALGVSNRDSDSVVPVQQFAYIDDVGIKIEEIIYLDDFLIFNVLVDMEETYDEQSFMGFGDISVTIDGKTNPLNGTTITETWDRTENIYSTIATVKLDEDISTAKAINITIEIEDIYFNDERLTSDKKVYEGQTHFEVQTSAEDLKQYIHSFPLNERFSAFNVDYLISEILIHPLLSLIEIQSDNASEDYQLMEIRGTDVLGRAVTFTPYHMTQSESRLSMWLHFSEADSEITVQELYDADVLNLQFYSAGHPNGTYATYEPYGELFEINLKTHAPE